MNPHCTARRGTIKKARQEMTNIYDNHAYRGNFHLFYKSQRTYFERIFVFLQLV